jgi:hypothetical protein
LSHTDTGLEANMALMDRVKGILLTPKQEWPTIDGEQTSVGGLYTGYIIPLSAIGPVASIIGWSAFGFSVPFVGSIKLPIGYAVRNAAITYVVGLVGVYVLALIVDALAPTFGGQKNQVQALKAVAYSYTAAWVAGALMVFPTLGIIILLASLYGLYLLYLGLPVVMKAPKEKAVGYTVVVVLVAIVLFVVIGLITSRFSYRPAGMPGI